MQARSAPKQHLTMLENKSTMPYYDPAIGKRRGGGPWGAGAIICPLNGRRLRASWLRILRAGPCETLRPSLGRVGNH